MFFSMDLSTVFDAPTVQALLAGMRVTEKWRLFRTRSLLAQAVPRYPTTERQKGNAQPQSGHFDLTSCFMMNRTLKQLFKKDLIPPAAASPEYPRDNLQIPKLPSSSVSTRTPLGLPSLSSLYNAEFVKSEESDELSFSSPWELDYW